MNNCHGADSICKNTKKNWNRYKKDSAKEERCLICQSGSGIIGWMALWFIIQNSPTIILVSQLFLVSLHFIYTHETEILFYYNTHNLHFGYYAHSCGGARCMGRRKHVQFE